VVAKRRDSPYARSAEPAWLIVAASGKE
jgi:hypothetical protein